MQSLNLFQFIIFQHQRRKSAEGLLHQVHRHLVPRLHLLRATFRSYVEFRRLNDGVVKAERPASLRPSARIWLAEIFVIWATSSFLREMMLTRANSIREKKMKQVQTRNQISMNLM